MKVNLNCRLIAKLGLLVVLIGFFMPIACDKNGFEIADHMVNNDNVLDGLLLYLVMATAVAGVIIGVFLLINKKVNPNVDWIVIIACIASGLVVFFRHLNNSNLDLQSGAYVILVGWIVALGAQLYSKLKKEK